jgi:cytochrome b561
MPANPPSHYSATLRTLHWLTVVCVIVCFGITYLEHYFPRGSAQRATIWWTHMSFGLLLLAFMVARLFARTTSEIPAPAATLPRPFRVASSLAHILLYALLIATPLVGMGLGFYQGRDVSFFGLFSIPSPVAADRAFGRQVEGVHEWLANALVALAIIHALAALAHHFVLKDDVLRRMLPARTRR